MRAFEVLAGGLATVVVAWSLGQHLTRVCLRRRDGGPLLLRTEAQLFSILLGAACLSSLVFWTCTLRIADWKVFAGIGAVSVLSVFRRKESYSEAGPRWNLPYAALFAIVAGFLAVHALKPEVSPDGSTYHLGLVARYLREHGFTSVVENLYAGFPKGMEMLFLYAFAFGGHSAAALVHYSLLLVLSAMLYLFGRRSGFELAGMCASLLTLLSPAMAMNGTTAYVDAALAAFAFATFWLIDLWRGEPRLGIVASIGLLAGFCFAIKYTGLVVLFYAIAVVGARSWRVGAPVIQRLGVLLAAAGLVSAPHLILNWAVRGNPVSPFLNSWFPNPLVHISFEQMARTLMSHYPGLSSLWQLPWEVTTRGGILQALLGPVFLLLPLSLLCLRYPLGRRMITAALIFSAPFAGNIGTRFLLPALPLWALAFSLALMRWPRLLLALVAFHVVTAVPFVTRWYAAPGLALLDSFPLREALRIIPEEEAILKLTAGHETTRLVQQNVPPDATVLALAWVMEAYTSANVRTHHLSAANERLAQTLWTPLTPGLRADKRVTFRFSPRALRGVRVELASGSQQPPMMLRPESGFALDRPIVPSDQWGVAELRLFNGAAELPRQPTWKIRTDPNPWDAILLADNNPVTLWRTWERARRSMFIELDTDAAVTADRVVLDTPNAQESLAFSVLAKDESGRWSTLVVERTETLQPPEANLRLWATASLRRENIDYLLVDSAVLGAKDLAARPEAWGIEAVAHTSGGTYLYRIPAQPGVAKVNASESTR